MCNREVTTVPYRGCQALEGKKLIKIRWPVCNTCQLAKCTSFCSLDVGRDIEQRTGVGGQRSDWKIKKIT